jgi:hypothetical protein
LFDCMNTFLADKEQGGKKNATCSRRDGTAKLARVDAKTDRG